MPAPAAGVLAQIIKNDGDTCISEEVIAKIDTEGGEAASGAMQINSVPQADRRPAKARRAAARSPRAPRRRAASRCRPPPS